ncbi:hypothetical protein NDU88_006532 [Pleurodeles waltl]|uniref:Uncharacterized protein n=1 Tax=Pleurodeles waltl TaxID=8319 RepID=A0AAV7LPW5_PLEWA|nr:hypothetical protein NDU88_006532 [Pleurodeles waltl]
MRGVTSGPNIERAVDPLEQPSDESESVPLSPRRSVYGMDVIRVASSSACAWASAACALEGGILMPDLFLLRASGRDSSRTAETPDIDLSLLTFLKKYGCDQKKGIDCTLCAYQDKLLDVSRPLVKILELILEMVKG